MSYVEHGPRVFLAGRPNTGMPLTYGDYVLPRKRLEGRLKLHDSCSDIRAWSPNSLENSRYFRELSEHDSPIGKIIPFNVVVDNIIRLNSQTQNELQMAIKELKKYKSLKLTSTQEAQFKNSDCNKKIEESLDEDDRTRDSLLKDAFLNISKSVPMIHANSCFSVHIPSEHFQNNKNDGLVVKNQLAQLYSYSLNVFHTDPSVNNYTLVSPRVSPLKSSLPTDYSEKSTSWIECIDVALQVERETHDVGVQFDGQVDKYLNRVLTASVMSQTSFMYKSSESNSDMEPDKSSLQTNNYEEQSFECDASCSESIQDTITVSEFDSEIESESDFDIHSNTHKGVIIQKDSEIIVLKNELCVRDAELEELRDINKNLENLLEEKEDCINAQQGNLKILHDTLMKLDHQRNCEVEELKEKFYSCKQLVEQLKEELNTKRESYYLQSQKIEKLELYVDKVKILQSEKNSLLEKLQDMEQITKKAESCNLALEQLKNVLQEKDELKKQNYEQSCMLADQEDEINRLLTLIEQTSVTYEEQKKTKSMLENLKAEIHDKTIKISQYEEQLLITKQEIGDFFNNLKHALNNLEEFNGSCDDICNCEKCDLDISEEANNVLCNINVIMTRFQSYKIERQNLLQQIEDLKHYLENDRQQVYINQNLKSMLSEGFYYESEADSRSPSGRDSVILLNIRQNQNNTDELEFGDTANSVNNEAFVNETTNNECYNYIIKLNKRNGVDEVEKEIIEYVKHSLNKIDNLNQKLQAYAEIERPSMMKQMYNFYELLKDTESAINTSQDITSRKERIFKLYNQHKEEREKCKSYVKQLPNDLSHIQNKINEFIETILYQLLDGVLHIERRDLGDKQINHVFEIHLRSCIDRINVAVQGAGNRRIQIAEEIENQQKELQRKDIEIARLKEEVAQHLACRGEGDCLNQEQSNTIIAIKEELAKMTVQLCEKNAVILKLDEQLKMIKNELSTCDKDCNKLRKQNKNLDNIKNRLSKECQQKKKQLISKNEEIKNLSGQVYDLFEIKSLQTSMENKIKEMEKELCHLEFENGELKTKLTQANELLGRNNETIIILKNTKDENEILTHKITEYKNAVEENHCEITKLENENKLLSEKLKHAENKIVEMNQTILSLTEQNDKIDIIYMLQEDLVKLDKNERKLKAELNNLKVQLVNDQNNNKKLDNNLDTFLRENETLKRNVEYWKNENSELSMKLCSQNIEEKLRSNLYTLSNRIYETLSSLKIQTNLGEYVTNDESNETLKNPYITYRNEKIEPAEDDTNKEPILEYKYQKREIKENEIEDVQEQLLNSTNINNEMYQSNYAMYGQLNSPENNGLRIGYTPNHLMSENKGNQNEKKKLLEEIEIRESEIRNLKQTTSRLTQENAYFRAILKSQIEEYQDKLTLMKKNYDSSLNALCERHKESVETLQRRFEDIIKDERIFEPENWLQTLNVNELTELYKRISVIIDSNRNLVHIEDENKCFYRNDLRNELYSEINKTCDKMQVSHKNICENEQMPNKIVSSILTKQTNSDLQNQWQFTILRQTEYPVLQVQESKLNLRQNFRCSNDGQKSAELENKYEKEKEVMRDNTFDQQRWNFINQCSAYHKSSNTYEYPKSVRKD